MHAITCDRHGCTLENGRIYTYHAMSYDWLCAECEGRIVQRSERDPETEIITDWAECGRCGGREFKPAGSVRQEQIEAVEVLAGLPQELQQAVVKARRRNDEAALKDAASLLY